MSPDKGKNMRYLYNYQTIVRFSGTVNSHFLKLRCVPHENDYQNIIQSEFIIHPDFIMNEGLDGFGNHILVGSSLDAHDSVAYVASGIVDLGPYIITEEEVEPFYYTETNLTAYSAQMDEMKLYHLGNKWMMALELCIMVNSIMFYTPGSTNIQTTAAQAFLTKQGVCQDYSHILIALCRHHGIAARYVNGFIVGEGETHAWVEVWDEQKSAWKGLDPTHGKVIETGYIKLAHGRDASDCPVSRGTYKGFTNQQTEIRVIVNKL